MILFPVSTLVHAFHGRMVFFCLSLFAVFPQISQCIYEAGLLFGTVFFAGAHITAKKFIIISKQSMFLVSLDGLIYRI